MLHPELYLESQNEGLELVFRIETADDSKSETITKEQAKGLSKLFGEFAEGKKSLNGKIVLIGN